MLDLTRYGVERNPGPVETIADMPSVGTKGVDWAPSKPGDWFEEQLLLRLQAHDAVQDAKRVGATGDKKADIVVLLRGGHAGLEYRSVQCRVRNQKRGHGPYAGHRDFGRTVFVLLNATRSRFYVVIAEELAVGKSGSGVDANEEHRIDYGVDSGRTEAEAWGLVVEKIVELLPRAEVFVAALSPKHTSEAAGVHIIRSVVASQPHLEGKLAAAQDASHDLTLAGAPLQVKASDNPHRPGLYRFHVRHGRTHSRPYEAGLSFAFVVNACTERFY